METEEKKQDESAKQDTTFSNRGLKFIKMALSFISPRALFLFSTRNHRHERNGNDKEIRTAHYRIIYESRIIINLMFLSSPPREIHFFLPLHISEGNAHTRLTRDGKCRSRNFHAVASKRIRFASFSRRQSMGKTQRRGRNGRALTFQATTCHSIVCDLDSNWFMCCYTEQRTLKRREGELSDYIKDNAILMKRKNCVHEF